MPEFIACASSTSILLISTHQPSKGLALIEPAMEILYNDCDPARTSELESYMLPHANLAFETKASAPAWADSGFDGKRVYVRTLLDCCNPSVLQDMWLEKTKVNCEYYFPPLTAPRLPCFGMI